MKYFVVILFVYVGFKSGLSGQCPDKQFLWHRIIYLRDSTKVPAGTTCRVVQFVDQMENCAYRNDSTHALLLQRIGWLFSLQKDFTEAIRYSKQSLDIVYRNLGKPMVNYAHVIKTYYNLRILYDSAGLRKLRQEATDSCIAVVLRLRTGYQYALSLLPTRAYSYLESGEYYKCIQFSTLARFTANLKLPIVLLAYYLSWRINSLILLSRFDEAGQLLNATINDFLKSDNETFVGNFYGLLARLSEEKQDEKNSVLYVKKCVAINEKAKQLLVCAQAINNLGYNLYYKRLQKYDLALSCYLEHLEVC